MRILIDILHPAHVHFFRHFASEMQTRGHSVQFTLRDKDCAKALLEAYDIPYTLLSVQRKGPIGLGVELLVRTRRLLQVVRKTKPDVLVGIMGASIALAGPLARVPAIVFYDTEGARLSNAYAYPLAHTVYTPDCYQGRVRGHHVTYAGYHELAYLHPNRFTANQDWRHEEGLSPKEPYSVARFVSWEASHDLGISGLSVQQKRELVSELARSGRVLISSESALPDDLQRFAIQSPPERIHHILAGAQLLVGESATMCSEAAVLGVHSVFLSSHSIGCLEELEQNYGVVHKFAPNDLAGALATIGELLTPAARIRASEARTRLLDEKLDVTEWMIREFEQLAHDNGL